VHSSDDELDAFLAGARMLRGIHVLNDLAAERRRKSVEGSEGTRFIGEACGKILREHDFSGLGVKEQCDFDGGAGVDAEFAPDAAVHMKPVAAAAPGHKSALHRQALDPAMHGNVQGVLSGNAAKGFGHVAGDIDAAHDPDFVDAGGKDVGLVRAVHVRARIIHLGRGGKDSRRPNRRPPPPRFFISVHSKGG
jgi:hypothetical protein